MVYALLIVLAVAAFLFSVNEFLRGRKKEHIDAYLTLVILGTMVVGFMTGGWRRGLFTIVAGIALVAIFRPLGVKVAARLLSTGRSGPGRHIGLPSRKLHSISVELGRDLEPEQIVRDLTSGKTGRRELAETALYQYCRDSPDTEAVLSEFTCGNEKLRELYYSLLEIGAGQWAGGHWVPASAIAYPHTLRFLLTKPLAGEVARRRVAVSLIEHFERGIPLETMGSDTARPA